jgi:hypothetical protein
MNNAAIKPLSQVAILRTESDRSVMVNSFMISKNVGLFFNIPFRVIPGVSNLVRGWAALYICIIYMAVIFLFQNIAVHRVLALSSFRRKERCKVWGTGAKTGSGFFCRQGFVLCVGIALKVSTQL